MAVLKTLAVFIVLTLFVVLQAPLYLTWKLIGNNTALLKISQYTAKTLLWIMGVSVSIKHIHEYPKGQGFMLVANHVSYLDILVLYALAPFRFITSVEVQRDWFLGTLCTLGGCLFVERRNRVKLQREIKIVAENLKQGINVVLFPEGTTSNGSTVLRFKATLMESAVLAGAPILPLCLNYTHINGQPISDEFSDKVYWYGDMTFFPHLVGLLSLRSIKIDLKVLAPIPISKSSTRKALADEAHRSITHCHREIVRSLKWHPPRQSS